MSFLSFLFYKNIYIFNINILYNMNKLLNIVNSRKKKSKKNKSRKNKSKKNKTKKNKSKKNKMKKNKLRKNKSKKIKYLSKNFNVKKIMEKLNRYYK